MAKKNDGKATLHIRVKGIDIDPNDDTVVTIDEFEVSVEASEKVVKKLKKQVTPYLEAFKKPEKNE